MVWLLNAQLLKIKRKSDFVRSTREEILPSICLYNYNNKLMKNEIWTITQEN